MDGQRETSYSLPTMYGDHHVVQVRQVVTALAGVTDIRASASRRTLTVKFDGGKLSDETIQVALSQAGFAPGAQPVSALGADEALPIVAAADQADVRESKYSPPPAFGVCPGLETRYVGAEHPGDRK